MQLHPNNDKNRVWLIWLGIKKKKHWPRKTYYLETKCMADHATTFQKKKKKGIIKHLGLHCQTNPLIVQEKKKDQVALGTRLVQ